MLSSKNISNIFNIPWRKQKLWGDSYQCFKKYEKRVSNKEDRFEKIFFGYWHFFAFVIVFPTNLKVIYAPINLLRLWIQKQNKTNAIAKCIYGHSRMA